MEVVLDNVVYKENINTPLQKTYIAKINATLEGNKIYTFLGDSNSGISKLGNLINMTVVPTSGKVRVNEFVNDGKYIKNINKHRMNTVFISAIPSDMLFNKTVKGELSFGLKYFKYKLKKEEIRVKDALKLVGLSEDLLNKKINDLTINEKKKVSIASMLIYNPDIIVMEEATLFLNHKDKELLKRLLITLRDKYKKMIILITKDVNFTYEVSDYVYIASEGKIVSKGTKNILENSKTLSKYNLDTPEIVKFINASNKYGAKLTYTNNILDLIKEVYRNAK